MSCVQDPSAGEDALLTLDEHRLGLGWAGDVILIKRDYRLRDEDQPFGLGLIVAQLLRDRRIARDIAVAAIMLSLLALGPIMFWRLLIDRVALLPEPRHARRLVRGDAGVDHLRDDLRLFAPLSRPSRHRPGRRSAVDLHVQQGH